MDVKEYEPFIKHFGYEWLLRMQGDHYYCNIYIDGIHINHNDKHYVLKETGEILEFKMFDATAPSPELALDNAYQAFKKAMTQ